MPRLGALAAFMFVIMWASVSWADGVFEAHVKALGGKHAIVKIKSIHRTGTVGGSSSYGPLNGTFEEIFDRTRQRGFSRMDLTGYSRRMGWTGSKGWVSDPQTGVTDMPLQQAAFASYGAEPSPLAALVATHGRKSVQRAGNKEFNDKDCIVVTIKGSPIEFFVNQNTKLLEGYLTPGGYEVTLEDYKTVQGIQLATKRTIKVEDQNLVMLYEFKTTKLNGKINDSTFKRPSSHDASPNAPQEEGSSIADQIIAFFDKNGDRRISKDEAPQELKGSFAYIDTNGDGLIDAKEAQVMLAYAKNGLAGSPKTAPTKPQRVTAKQLIGTMDKNSDDKITKHEASEDLKLFFGDIDTNGDGSIDVKEAEVIARFVNEQAGVSEPEGHPVAPHGKVTARQMIDSIDKNSDGKITRDEASDELKQNFQFVDTNGDGAIDIKEAQIIADYVNNQQKR